MRQYIGCDTHTRYSVFVSVDEAGKISKPVRVDQLKMDVTLPLAQYFCASAAGKIHIIVIAQQ